MMLEVVIVLMVTKYSCAEKLLNTSVFPWIGVLQVKIGKVEAVTGLILIAEAKAIGNANEVTKVDKNMLRKSANAMFFEDNLPWSCPIQDYIVHPEFDKDTINTIAIVNLNCKRGKWIPVNWSEEDILPKFVYAVGLADENKVFNQVMYKMMPVNMNKCREFYYIEKINFKYLWPSTCLCYRGITKHSCNFDSGMALATVLEGNWTLLGISILGPGCNLPSRYINFQQYVPWIKRFLPKQKISRRKMTEEVKEVKVIDPAEDIVSNSHFIEDDFYVSKLDDSTMVLRPGYANIKEAVYGDCLSNEGIMLYRETGLVRAPGYTATGVYAMSLYDLYYNKITCVTVSVRCKKRSITKFWLEKGFNKDDFSDLIKVIPFPKRGPVPPKILFLTDDYTKYDNITIANLVFKFEFRHEATIHIDFYGTLISTRVESTTETNNSTNTRRTVLRTHRRNLYSTESPILWGYSNEDK